MGMLTLTRKTKDIVYNGKILSSSFTQVLPITTDKPAEEALAELVRNRIIKNKTAWFATDDWGTKADKYFPTGAGDYEYQFVETPKTEKHIMILGNTGFDNYYNDEYTRSGDCEFFIGPYPDLDSARQAAQTAMNEFVYEEWAEENEMPLADNYYSNCEGKYTSMYVVQIDVIA